MEGEKILISKKYRFIIDQSVGISKVIDHLREKYDVTELDNGRIIIVEEKELEK
jgi:hypothetical protein